MRIVHKILIAGTISFAIAISVAAYRMVEKQTSIRDKCAPTELFVINSRHRATRVYDCSNLEEENE